MANLPNQNDIKNSATQGILQDNLEAHRDVTAQMIGGAYQDDFASALELTIASDAITPTMAIHDVAPQTGNSDDLDTIVQTNFPEGRVLVIRNTDASNAITVKHGSSGAGHIRLKGSADLIMNSGEDVLELLRDPTSPGFWVELRHDFGAAGGGSASDHSHFNFVPPEGGEAPDTSRTTFSVPHHYELGSLVVVYNSGEQETGASADIKEDAGIVNLATANWVAATKKLTQVAAFANYTWVSGDKIWISAGTGITPSWETIVSKDDDDTIELGTDDISAIDLSNSDIESKRAYNVDSFVPASGISLWSHLTVAQ